MASAAFNIFTSDPKGAFPPVPMAKADGYDLMLVEREPLREIAFNHINDRDETVVVAKGSAQFRVGEKQVYLNEGDVLVIPAGIAHGDFKAGPKGYRALQIESNRSTKPLSDNFKRISNIFEKLFQKSS